MMTELLLGAATIPAFYTAEIPDAPKRAYCQYAIEIDNSQEHPSSVELAIKNCLEQKSRRTVELQMKALNRSNKLDEEIKYEIDYISHVRNKEMGEYCEIVNRTAYCVVNVTQSFIKTIRDTDITGEFKKPAKTGDKWRDFYNQQGWDYD